MNNNLLIQSGALKAYVFLVAWLIVSGWLCSSLGWLSFQWIPAVAGLAGFGVLLRRPAASWRELGAALVEPFACWPWALVALLALLACFSYPPVMLDSLTYRLPRMLLWLREGHVVHFETAEARLNYLCHGWELCTLPLFKTFGPSASWVWAFISWLASQIVFFGWAVQTGGSVPRARQMAFIASTTTFGVLQASSTANDLMAVTLLLTAAHFIQRFETEPRPGRVNWAITAFCLAAAVKPHYALLLVPLGLWFLFARSQPWKVFTWRWAPLLVPLWLICSPLPTFLLNGQTYGSWTGPASGTTFQGAGPSWNILFGVPQMVWQMVLPCVNPLALKFNEPIAQYVASLGIHHYAPRFTLRMAPISMVDNASIGLLSSIIGLTGLWLAWRRSRPAWSSFPVMLALAGVFGFLLGVSQFLPQSIGRSFAGFVFLSVPLVIVGWNQFSDCTLRQVVLLSLAGALVAIVLNPARPLWPAEGLQHWFAQRGQAGIAAKLETYTLVQERRRAGSDLVDAIPASESSFVALIAEDRPIFSILWPNPRHRRIILLPAHATPAQLLAQPVNYVLVSSSLEESYPELADYFKHTRDFELVMTRAYVSKLARGANPWFLYRRVQPVSAATNAAPSGVTAPAAP